jgi:hypothetical protein
MRSVPRYLSCLKRNTLPNRVYLARALVAAASVLPLLGGHGDTGARGPANAWVYGDAHPSLIPEAAESAR